MVGLWLAIYDNLRVIFILCLNLSSFYRLLQYANQIRLFKVNTSIKDMEQKVTSLATTIFNLGVIALTGEPDRLLLASTAVTLLLLAQKMCNEQYRLQHIAAGLHDMNLNRLSTFETALLWVKICEDFLDDDIMFNWVQIFRTQERLGPEILDHGSEGLQGDHHRAADATNLDGMIADSEEQIANCYEYLKGSGIETIQQHYIQRNHDLTGACTDEQLRDLLFMPTQQAADADMFGTDDKGGIATPQLLGLSSTVELRPEVSYTQALTSRFASSSEPCATFELTADGIAKLEAWVRNADRCVRGARPAEWVRPLTRACETFVRGKSVSQPDSL